MYDYLLHETANNQRYPEMLRQAEKDRLALAVRERNQSVSRRVARPVRRAAHLVAALIR